MSEYPIEYDEEGGLAAKKAWRRKRVDIKTQELISQGFVFDSKVFSLSEPAQINWLGLRSLSSMLSWPVTITTKNDEEYELAEEDLDSFAGTAAATKQAHLDSGRDLKIDITDAADEEELDAIVDDR